MGEWVEWKGGVCPMAFKTRVSVKMRDGHVCNGFSAGAFQWSHTQNRADIIAYRVIEPEQQAHAMSHPALQTSAAQEITSLELQCTRALAERDALRAEVERLNKQVEIANAVATCCKAGEAMARREIERLRKGREDEKARAVVADSVANIDDNSVANAGVRFTSLANTLDHRLGIPQPDGEPVEPMSAQSWKRRMYGS